MPPRQILWGILIPQRQKTIPSTANGSLDQHTPPRNLTGASTSFPPRLSASAPEPPVAPLSSAAMASAAPSTMTPGGAVPSAAAIAATGETHRLCKACSKKRDIQHFYGVSRQSWHEQSPKFLKTCNECREKRSAAKQSSSPGPPPPAIGKRRGRGQNSPATQSNGNKLLETTGTPNTTGRGGSDSSIEDSIQLKKPPFLTQRPGEASQSGRQASSGIVPASTAPGTSMASPSKNEGSAELKTSSTVPVRTHNKRNAPSVGSVSAKLAKLAKRTRVSISSPAQTGEDSEGALDDLRQPAFLPKRRHQRHVSETPPPTVQPDIVRYGQDPESPSQVERAISAPDFPPSENASSVSMYDVRSASVQIQDESGYNAALQATTERPGEGLVAFATSLHRLGDLLVQVNDCLSPQAIHDLECEIHHDWRVDEMATYVEGYLKGARDRRESTANAPHLGA